jgi:hypothetical protein
MGKWGTEPWGLWKTHWRNRTALGNRRLSIAILTTFSIAAGIPYVLLNRLSNLVGRTAFNPEIPLDFEIPFLAWMVIPYMTLYLYYPVSAFLGNKTDTMWRQNILFHQMMILSSWMCFLVFLVFPVEIDLRHQIVGLEGSFWEPLIGLVHSADRPWNAWPSLHVVQSAQVVLILRYWYPSTTLKVSILQAVLLVCCALLIISTLTIKQHYIWDAITALVFTGLTWKYWMRPALDAVRSEQGTAEFDALLE